MTLLMSKSILVCVCFMFKAILFLPSTHVVSAAPVRLAWPQHEHITLNKRIPNENFHTIGLFATRTGDNGNDTRRDNLPQYQTTAPITDLPEQPDQMVQMLFSIILSSSNFTGPISNAIINCVSSATSTQAEHIGVYNAGLFANSFIQAEYYADVSEDHSITFPETLDTYIREGGLTKCVREQEIGFAPPAALINGRATIAPRTESIISSSGVIPGWAVGAVVGIFGLIAVIGLIFISMTGQKIYPQSSYARDFSDEFTTGSEAKGDSLAYKFEHNISTQVRNLAGQRREASLAAV